MRILTSAALTELNKVATDSADIILLEIQLSGATIRLARNNEDLEWDSETWQAFEFDLDTVNEAGKGEIPAVVAKVSNVTGEIQQYIEAANGASGTPIIIRVINTKTGGAALLELSYILDRISYDELVMSFHLTGANSLTRRIPRWRYLKNFCRFGGNYGGIDCGVSAATVTSFPTCDGTYEQCLARSNSARFGGFRFMPDL